MSRRRFTSLVGWLSAEAISLSGTRLSMIAIPWFVLTTTGSATKTGLVGFAEMAPYVAAKAFGGPLIDRLGPRKVSATADTASLVVVGAIPLLHSLELLAYPLLLGLVALAGLLRGPGDAAKHALAPEIAEIAAVPMERVTGLVGVIERLATTAGAAAAGVLVALLGPATALALDAATFGVAAVLIAATAPRTVHRDESGADAGGYLTQLRTGWNFLRKDPVLVAITVMVGTTNLLDQAFTTVLVPVWAHSSGRGAAAIGLLFAVFAAASTIGSLIAAAVAERLPRYTTYLVCFLIAGMPRFLVLALDAPLPAILVVGACGGFAAGFLNPILGAVIFERIPKPLIGRVSSLTTSLAWAGMPLGGVVGGGLIAMAGLAPALLVCGTAYFVATMLPAVRPEWRQIDKQRPTPGTPGPASPEQVADDRVGEQSTTTR